MDVRGYLESRDPETGELQWRWYTTPEKMGEPGSETWPNAGRHDHGGGMTWMPGTYDPELNLIYWGTGNANPVFAGQARKGVEPVYGVDRGAEPGHRQARVVFPGVAARHARLGQRRNAGAVRREIDGKPRKLLAQGARAGWFFVLDRTNGKNLVSKPFSGTGNWAIGSRCEGAADPRIPRRSRRWTGR